MGALESDTVLLTSKQAKLVIPVLMFLLTFPLLKRDKSLAARYLEHSISKL